VLDEGHIQAVLLIGPLFQAKLHQPHPALCKSHWETLHTPFTWCLPLKVQLQKWHVASFLCYLTMLIRSQNETVSREVVMAD
jgi:hypothetical protein